MLKIRLAFLLLFVLTVLGGVYAREGEPAEMAIAGAAAAGVAMLVILVESWYSRGAAAYLSSVIYGSLLGWLAGLVLTSLLSLLPVWFVAVDPFRRAVLMLAFSYAGAVAAVRAKAAGCRVLRLRMKRETPAGRAGRAAAGVHLAAVLLAAACASHMFIGPDSIGPDSIGRDAGPGGRSDIIILAAAVLAVGAADVFLGGRLPRAIAVLLPALLFAAVVTGETFTILSAGSWLNFHISLEIQQLALFILWLYAGVAMMLRAALAGRQTPPFVVLVE